MLVILFFTLLSGVLYSQEDKRSINVMGSSVLFNEVYDYEYTFNSNGSSTFKLNLIRIQESITSTFYDFEFDIFKTECGWMIDSFLILILKNNSKAVSSIFPYLKTEDEKKEIDFFISKIFFNIKSRVDFAESEPQVAFIKLRSDTISMYPDQPFTSRIFKKINVRPLHSPTSGFLIEKAQIEFEEGVIKNIYLDVLSPPLKVGYLDGTESRISLRFKNWTPISISSRNDDNRFSDYPIVLSDPGYVENELLRIAGIYEVKKQEFVVEENSNKIRKYYNWYSKAPRLRFLRLWREGYIFSKESDYGTLVSCYIGVKWFFFKMRKTKLNFSLAELIDYKSLLDVDREDYSPQNCVVELSPENPVVELKKIKKSRILTSKAFSDFLGFQKDNPNGLVQSEVSTRFLLNTTKGGEGFFNFGLFSYIEPKFIFSKIEDNNRNLLFTQNDLHLPDLSMNQKVFNTNPIDLFQQQRFSFDMDLNALKFNLPGIKSNFRLNCTAGVSQLNSVDTINVLNNTFENSILPNMNTINNLKYGYMFMMEVKPEKRYGINVAYEWRKYDLLSDGYRFSGNNVLQTVLTEAFIKTNDESNSTLFFRTRLSYNGKIERNVNFLQIQLGFLFDIFKSKTK
jgi:hypothetical protein